MRSIILASEVYFLAPYQYIFEDIIVVYGNRSEFNQDFSCGVQKILDCIIGLEIGNVYFPEYYHSRLIWGHSWSDQAHSFYRVFVTHASLFNSPRQAKKTKQTELLFHKRQGLIKWIFAIHCYCYSSQTNSFCTYFILLKEHAWVWLTKKRRHN